MAGKNRDFTDILLKKGIVSLDQVSEASRMARENNCSLAEALVRTGYASEEDVTRALAEHHRVEYVDLSEITIPESVVELVPESVARENEILPMAEEEDMLVVLVSDPLDIETIEKLRFILNRRVEIALAPPSMIREAINRYYGQVEGEIGRLHASGIHRHRHRFHRNGTRRGAAAGEGVDENSARSFA